MLLKLQRPLLLVDLASSQLLVSSPTAVPPDSSSGRQEKAEVQRGWIRTIWTYWSQCSVQALETGHMFDRSLRLKCCFFNNTLVLPPNATFTPGREGAFKPPFLMKSLTHLDKLFGLRRSKPSHSRVATKLMSIFYVQNRESLNWC